MNPSKIYLYLVKRDRKDIKIIMILQGKYIPATKINDVFSLRLTPDIMPELLSILDEHKMKWELWAESADSFENLKTKLEKRGFTNIYNKSKPIHSASSFNNPHIADTRNVNSRKTMLRKSS